MANQEVKVAFKIDGLDGYITDLGQLQEALGKAAEETSDLNKQTDSFSKGGKLFQKTLRGIGTVGKKAFGLIKAGIAATGLGVFLNLGAKLAEWFNQTDVGAKLVQGSLAAIGVIFNRLGDLLAPLGDALVRLFNDPKQSLIDFGNLLKQNITDKVNSILEGIGFLGSAISKVFSGDFSGAAEDAKNAFTKIAVEGTFLGDAIDGVTSVVEATTEAFSGVVEEIGNAVAASSALVDAQNGLKKTQQELTVENAKLNQELETQQRIADDTTLSYDERKAALDRVNAANEQLADNAVRLAEEEKAVLEQQLALALTDAERLEIKGQLADAEAALIDAETQAQLTRLESAQLNRELDQEEADRKEEAANQAKEDAEKAKEEADKARAEELKTIQEQNDAIVKAEESLQDAKFNAAQQGIAALQSLAGDNEKIQNALFVVDKAVALGKVIIDSVKAKAANLAYAAGLGPAGPAYLAAANQAVNLNTAASVATIAATTIAKFKGGGAAGAIGNNETSFNPGSSINYNFDQNAGETIVPGQGQTQQPPIQAYVVSGDIVNAAEAEAQIQNLARL